MIRRGLSSIVTVLALAVMPEALGQSSVGLKARLDPIVKAQVEARQCYHRDLEGKTTSETQKPVVDRFLAETARNMEEVLGLVVANPDDPTVVEALKFVIKEARAGPRDESYRAMEILLRDPVRDPGLGEICGWIIHFVHAPVAESLLRAVLEKHPNRDERGQACYALAEYLRYQAKMVRRIREKPERIDEWVHERHKRATERFVKEADPEALEKQSEPLLERVITEFADVKRWYDQQPLGAIAEGELFALRNVRVGRVTLEIAGKDHEGNSFSLSEYRGKVVLLSFSGNWCGPCVAMYPQERALVTKLATKPFALLSVNTDENVEALRNSIASGEITWRCWWDGGTNGPITSRWGILGFPSFFLLDQAGTIRFKDIRFEDLEQAVVSLLDEAPAETPAKP